MVTCREAVVEAVKELGGVVSTTDVVDQIYRTYPDRPWKPVSIRCHLTGLSVNHSSAKHYPSLYRQACLYHVGGGRFRLFDPEKDDASLTIEDDETTEDEIMEEFFEPTLSLERDLEEYIIRDLGQIEDGLELYTEEGSSGRQFNTEVGRLDILAKDRNGSFVVVELKAGTARYAVIGQILSYTSWIRQHMSPGKPVRGIIVADDFDKRVQYAASEMPNLSLKKYQVTFALKDVKLNPE